VYLLSASNKKIHFKKHNCVYDINYLKEKKDISSTGLFAFPSYLLASVKRAK